MCPLTAHDYYSHWILSAIAAGDTITQRAIARELGIALGLSNRLIRRLGECGWIRTSRHARGRQQYQITRKGLVERSRLEATRLKESLAVFQASRNELHAALLALSASWSDADARAARGQDKRIAFYGVGELAEIAYVAASQTDLRVIGAVDDAGCSSFFGLPVHTLDRLSADGLDGSPFGRLVVVSLDDPDSVRSRVTARGVSQERLFFPKA